MASVVNWAKRNKGKLVAGTAIAGGLYFVGRIAERRLIQVQERESLKVIEKAKKQNHFLATENTCAHTLSALFPTLRKSIEDKLDTDSLTKLLRENPSQSDKIALWNDLKVIAISRCLVVVLGGTYLTILIQTQLNILAGYLFGQEISGINDNKPEEGKEKIPNIVQEKFLNNCTYFVSDGVNKLCKVVSEVVKACTSKINLNQKLSLVDIEAVLNDVFTSYKTLVSDHNIFTNPGFFFFPDSDTFESDILPSDKTVLKQMFVELLDVIDSEDCVSMSQLVCKQGLSHTVDKIAEYYSAIGMSANNNDDKSQTEESKNQLHDSGFVSPANISLPLAKLIPILSAQAHINDDEDDEWLSHLQDNPSVKLLGANVYETFSEISSKPTNSLESWGDYLCQTLTNLF